MKIKLAVLGAGSWGTALAAHLAGTGHQVSLWGRNSQQMQQMAACGRNTQYLPDCTLPDNLTYTHDLTAAVKNVDGVVIATPCHSFVTLLDSLATELPPECRLIWACKGITRNKLLHEVVADKFGSRYDTGVISGPSFAGELVRGLPTAVTIAAADLDTAEQFCHWFHGETFRAYASDDMIGVQIAGALKNVFAIAAGISDGLGYGANARSALITRGLAELMRLGNAMGASRDTLMGLSGVGDLVLTCTDDQSRNRRLGLALGAAQNVQQATDSIGQVVEGINTSREAAELASRYQVEMPITDEVYKVIHQAKPAHHAVTDLLSRAPKKELD